jgi:hypothetical protein
VKRIGKRLTYANVMSSIAVFLLLGGGAAFAAHRLGKHTVGAKQLKANAVTAKKIRKNAVTHRKLRANAVTGGKVKDGSLTGADINLGTVGTVPSAANAVNAVNATNAVNAQKVNGQSPAKLYMTLLPGETNVTVATIAGFRIAASCATGKVDVSLSSPSSPGSVISAQGNGEVAGPYFEYESEENGKTSSIDLDGGNAFGQASFSGALEDGTVVSGVLGYDYETFGGAAPDRCIVYGQAASG